MKIPKVEKLPSGRYRVQVQVGGQRYGETFDTPEEAQFWAAGIKTRIKDARKPARRQKSLRIFPPSPIGA